MYHSLSILLERSSSSSFENLIAGLRKDGKEPGRLASSTLSDSSVSLRMRVGDGGAMSGRDEGAGG